MLSVNSGHFVVKDLPRTHLYCINISTIYEDCKNNTNIPVVRSQFRKNIIVVFTIQEKKRESCVLPEDKEFSLDVESSPELSGEQQAFLKTTEENEDVKTQQCEDQQRQTVQKQQQQQQQQQSQNQHQNGLIDGTSKKGEKQ